MSFGEKIKNWMDRWVGTPQITVLTEDLSDTHASLMEFQWNAPSEDIKSSRKTIRMQDVFLLDQKAKVQTPKDTVALYLPEREVIMVRSPINGGIDRLIPFRNTQGMTPLCGRFGPKGEESVALYDPKAGYFRIWESIEDSEPHYQFLFGPPKCGWIPLAGDWDGDGRDGIGLYCPQTSTFLLKNDLEGGEPDRTFMFGAPQSQWKPLVGDWNGDGRSGVGLLNAGEGVFYLRNTLEGGEHEIQIQLSIKGPDLIPISGDWNGWGRDSVGVFDPREFSFYLETVDAASDWMQFKYGISDDVGVPLRMQVTSGTPREAAPAR